MQSKQVESAHAAAQKLVQQAARTVIIEELVEISTKLADLGPGAIPAILRGLQAHQASETDGAVLEALLRALRWNPAARNLDEQKLLLTLLFQLKDHPDPDVREAAAETAKELYFDHS